MAKLSLKLSNPLFSEFYVLAFVMNNNVYYSSGRIGGYFEGGSKTYLDAAIYPTKQEAIEAQKRDDRARKGERDFETYKLHVYSFADILPIHLSCCNSYARHHFYRGLPELENKLLKLSEEIQQKNKTVDVNSFVFDDNLSTFKNDLSIEKDKIELIVNALYLFDEKLTKLIQEVSEIKSLLSQRSK